MKYNLDGVSRLEGIMGCFNALGTIAFAYGGHNVVLEIQVGTCLSQQSSLSCCKAAQWLQLLCMHVFSSQKVCRGCFAWFQSMSLVYASRRLASSPVSCMHAQAPLALQHVPVPMSLCLLTSMLCDRVHTLGINTSDQNLYALHGQPGSTLGFSLT